MACGREMVGMAFGGCGGPRLSRPLWINVDSSPGGRRSLGAAEPDRDTCWALDQLR
jgi:hypothetical protein